MLKDNNKKLPTKETFTKKGGMKVMPLLATDVTEALWYQEILIGKEELEA